MRLSCLALPVVFIIYSCFHMLPLYECAAIDVGMSAYAYSVDTFLQVGETDMMHALVCRQGDGVGKHTLRGIYV